MLLERERALADLLGAVRRADGRLVLVAGEAGAGKTALVRAALEQLPAGTTALLGTCDSMRTPRPLGPLSDWATRADPDLAAAVRAGAQRQALFDAALALLRRGPVVAVLEDAHWADEATVDLLVFLGRRLTSTRAALVVTCRSDEVAGDAPLALALGELATLPPVRIAVPPLSREAVRQLAEGSAVDAQVLHARTGGNAFQVTECLAAGSTEVPEGVRAAVLARAARLPVDARAALDALSVVPGAVEPWLAEAVGSGPALDECVARGLLVTDGPVLRFRHELGRVAVEQALLPHRRSALHRRALEALEHAPAGVDPARLAHHAAAGGDRQAVLRHAPAAAAAAEAAGARREAVAHLELALQHGGALPAAEHAGLEARLAAQCTLLGRSAEAVAAYDRALGRDADPQRRAELLLASTGALVTLGHTDEVHRRLDEAVALLEGGPPTRALGLALVSRCSAHMLARRLDEAEHWGRRALDLAVELGDAPLETSALVQSGVALWMSGDEAGLERLRRGVARAEADGDWARVCLGLSQIGSGGGEVQRYAEAVPALERCVALAEEHEITASALYARAWLGRCRLETGDWDAASAELSTALRSPRCDGIARVTALAALGRLRCRRGDPDVDGPLDEALALARRSAHLQRLWPVAAARAEAAEAQGRLADEVPLLQEVLDLAVELAWPWAVGELVVWLARAGQPVPDVPVAAPYDLLLAGQLRSAAQVWAARGRAFDEADALARSEDDEDQRRALRLLELLGARPAAQRLVARRRAQGRPVPRGPNGRTRGNPAGLTGRELEVLRCVAQGCSNREVGELLHLSAKTVGHHVSHLLAKLDARSRAEAVATAARLGVDLAPG